MSVEGTKQSPFVGEAGGFEQLTKEKLVSELFSANKENISRKTRTLKPFGTAAVELLAFHMSDLVSKKEMVPAGTIRHKVPNAGDYLRAFIWFLDNRNISLEGLARAEYITALQGVNEMESVDLKKQRQLESIIGI